MKTLTLPHIPPDIKLPQPEGLDKLENAIKSGDCTAFKKVFTEIVSEGRKPISEYTDCLRIAQTYKQSAIAEFLLWNGVEVKEPIFRMALQQRHYQFLDLICAIG
jgi:hypothetical protein